MKSNLKRKGSGFRTRVKICGITTLDDALMVAECGADALGFNFYEGSKRFISLKQAQSIIRRLPPFVATVAVMVNPNLDWVQQALLSCRIDFLQMHGQETPEFLGQFPGDKLIKGLTLRSQKDLKKLKAYPTVSAFLLDSFHPALAGGTGRRFPWEYALKAKQSRKPIILAGGLTPENVGEAVRQVRPFAVDVASGVEETPGKKNFKKVAAFIKAVQLENQALRG